VPLAEILRQVRSAGFGCVMADVPDELSVEEYQALLAHHGLQPAPGYFSAPFHDSDRLPAILECARRSAGELAQLEVTEVFVAAAMDGQRMARPAVGVAYSGPTLDRLTDNLARSAQVMSAEGVRACVHPHVGTLIEVEREVRQVLDQTDPDVVAFGPDTGHLFWAGMEPAALIDEYADRVAGVHLKDVHESVARWSRETGMDYQRATGERHLWTEPGRGDIDLDAVVDALGQQFSGWWLVEVDVPDGVSPYDSARLCADWVTEHLAVGASQEAYP
jgi:inosose dehydratase